MGSFAYICIYLVGLVIALNIQDYRGAFAKFDKDDSMPWIICVMWPVVLVILILFFPIRWVVFFIGDLLTKDKWAKFRESINRKPDSYE
jgi:hypothetical protein